MYCTQCGKEFAAVGIEICMNSDCDVVGKPASEIIWPPGKYFAMSGEKVPQPLTAIIVFTILNGRLESFNICRNEKDISTDMLNDQERRDLERALRRMLTAFDDDGEDRFGQWNTEEK